MDHTESAVFPPILKIRRKQASKQKTPLRGLEVLNSPSLNKGSAFSAEERNSLGLTGLIPPEIGSLDKQVKQAYLQYSRLPDALGKNVYLTALHDRNEVLYFRLFAEHLREMIPIVNDINVGIAMQQYRLECRRPRGVYLSIDHPQTLEQTFANFATPPDQIDLILATDAGQILGIGDWGVEGIEVAISKLAIYTAAAGINPARVLPVMLDVGTNSALLLEDPLYIGNRHPRIEGEDYDSFIASFAETVSRLFPRAILQWEDFAPVQGRRILAKYRPSMPTFNENLQGVGVITLAAAISAVRSCGVPLRNQRIVLFGAGTAGIGAASQIRDAMQREGLSSEGASSRFWCVDRDGLITTDTIKRPDQLPFARSPIEARTFRHDISGRVSLEEVVRRVRPSMLIGASGSPGAFTQSIIHDMANHTQRPVIFILSSPQFSAEASPSDLIAWTDGRALVATAGSNPPMTRKGVTYVIGQIDPAILCPGLALGAIVSQASRISDGMMIAAANAVSSLVTVRQPGSSLLPLVDDLRAVSLTVAVAVAEAAKDEGLSQAPFTDIVQQVRDAMWQPEYCPIEAA
jgi:malate dehydrogenase (oxaloacetate-decarboxylating)